MTTEMTYRAASWDLLRQGYSEWAAGDLRQASEKGWGAAAQMVKAVAEKRGWGHNSHGLLWRAIRDLSADPAEEDLAELFKVADGLHKNFYENWMPAPSVHRDLEYVELLLEHLQMMLEE